MTESQFSNSDLESDVQIEVTSVEPIANLQPTLPDVNVVLNSDIDPELPPWKRRNFSRHRWTAEELTNPSVHAPVGLRWGAQIVDGIVVGLLMSTLLSGIWLSVAPSLLVHDWCTFGVLVFISMLVPSTILGPFFILPLLAVLSGMSDQGLGQVDGFLACMLLEFALLGLRIVVDMTYRVLLESFYRQATLGEMIFGMYVANLSGRKISLWQGIVRYIFSSLTFGTVNKIAGTLIVKDSSDKPIQALPDLHNKIPSSAVEANSPESPG